MALAFQSIPPVIPLIIEDLKISHAQAGLLMGLFFLPGILLSIPVGFLADRYKARNIIAPSLILIIVGCVMVALSPSYILVSAGRFITGIGALTTSIVIPTIIARWFMSKELGLSMSIFHTGVPLGSVISFNVMPALAGIFGWRSSQLLTASVALVALIVFLFIFVESPAGKKKEIQAGQRSLAGILNIGAPVWLLGIIWMLYTSSVSSFLSFSTDFLVRTGFSITMAGFASGLLPVATLIFTPVAGLLIDRFHSQKLFIASAGLILAGFYMIIFYFPGYSLPLMFTAGIFSSLVPPSVSTLVTQFVKPEKMGLAFGLTNTLSNAGGMFGPYVAGFLRDFSGSYHLSFWFYTFLSVLSTAALLVIVWKKYRTTALIN